MINKSSIFISLQDDDDDDDDSEEDRETPSYTAISNTPTRITLTAKVSQKRKRGPNKIKVKDKDIHVCKFSFDFFSFFFTYFYWLSNWIIFITDRRKPWKRQETQKKTGRLRILFPAFHQIINFTLWLSNISFTVSSYNWAIHLETVSLVDDF